MKFERFIECDICKAKPGMPILCNPCLNNRNLIDKLDSISDKHEEYIKFLEANISLNAGFLHVHGITTPDAVIEQGRILREQIEELKK